MKYLMMAIVVLMLASIVGILVVKPFDRGNGKDAETPATIAVSVAYSAAFVAD